jgi:hypothetical protein
MSQGQKVIKTGGITDNGYSQITTRESCGCSSDAAEVIFVKSQFPEASWVVSLPLPCVKRFIRLNVNTLLLLNFSFHWNIGRDRVHNIDPSSMCELLHLAQPP